MTQYLAFRCKRPEWANEQFPRLQLKKIAQEYQLSAVINNLENYEWLAQENSGSQMWNHASSTPHRLGVETGDYFLQILDEFQYLNQFIGCAAFDQ